MKPIFSCLVQLINKTSDTGQNIIQERTASKAFAFETGYGVVRGWKLRHLGAIFLEENGQTTTVTSGCYTEMLRTFVKPKIYTFRDHKLIFQQGTIVR